MTTERLTPIKELLGLFAADDTSNVGRMRRLAIIATMQMPDREEAEAMHSALESAIMLFEERPEDGRAVLEMIDLSAASTASS